MKGSSLVLSSTLLSCANALQLHKRHNPSIVSVNFEKRTKDVFPGHEKRGNDEIVEMKVDQQGVLYWANFTIGNPPQRLSAEIDTGSSDSIVLTNQIETCVWEGTYANDTFMLGSSTLESLQFVGVSECNATTNGITSTFGVGLYTREHAETKYPNLLYALAEAEEINTPAFSLWLDNETHGEFLFGGVNKAKYIGPLVSYPVAFDNRIRFHQLVYYDDTTNIMLGDDFLRGAYITYGWANMEISLAQYNSEEAEDDILEIIQDVPGASAATGVPRRYLKYDQPADDWVGYKFGGTLSTAAEAGDVEDNGAAGSLLANLMYMMLITFVFNVVIHA
ncbi:hypothetical protein FOYG_14401 [Fusarium oxysporum NRRL 32931]|uniref:Peptidase A1 domain-containing protein n=1 Tax=Fusarium oxysporum NRRL 32931 TaxID=660029 RepID=W9HPZ0_FUSOX|nr:hypothetical protein FOYG_14401 [Fusarium oxysporum NRRL 32931]